MRTVFFLLVALLCASGPSVLVAQSAVPASGTPTLRPGDAVRITVWRNPELSGEFAIAADGSIVHPLYREVVVSGLTTDEAEERVRELLTRFEATPRFAMEPLLSISVGGEVRQPSLYKLPPSTSIAEAVAQAGGATERGRLDRVRLFRGGQELAVDLTQPKVGVAQESIHSGDQIFVERKSSVFREYIVPAGSITAAIAALLRLFI